MLTLYSDGLGGARELPAIEIPIRLFRSVDQYKYATQERKNGRGGQLVVIIKRLGAIESNNPGRC